MTLTLRNLFSICLVAIGMDAVAMVDGEYRDDVGTRRDSVQLNTIVVMGKSRVQSLKESAYSVNAVDVRQQINSVNNLADIISRSSGINIRKEGGLGSDFNLSVNGMSGNSIRYFIDGVPMQSRGGGANISNIPLNNIDHVEIYKGVVPSFLGSDALGGAINIVTRREHRSFVDASVSVGSFHTYRADVNSQIVLNNNGLLLRPQFSYDYSKNDYKVHGVEVWNDNESRYDTVSRRRFHDRYVSIQGQIDMGVEHKSWTDQFLVGVGFNNIKKELQTGTVQNIVYGKAERNQDAVDVHASYRKRGFLTDRLSAILHLSHTWDHSVTIDTALLRYSWNGTYRPTTKNETSGRGRMFRHYKRPMTLGRANFSYEINDFSSLALNYSYSRTGNKRYDTTLDYYQDEGNDSYFTPSTDHVEKHIIGLGYDLSLMDERFVTAVFLKDYVNHVSSQQTDLSWITHSDEVPTSATKNFIGYGLATRFAVSGFFAPKFSYEHSVRLPQVNELLGNGTTTYPNLALRPETSHNINLGAYGTIPLGKEHSIYYELSGFLRFTKDYIHLRINNSDGTAQYENVNDVTTRGLEGEVRYSCSDWLQFSTNVSYQVSKDMNQYLENGNKSATYLNRIPNRPWLNANSELMLKHSGILQKDDCLRFTYAYKYVHWFYLTWEAYGYKPSKARIPTQNMHDASLTYSWRAETYNLSLLCENMFDATSYDNYKLQKPGRNFTLKFRIYLR